MVSIFTFSGLFRGAAPAALALAAALCLPPASAFADGAPSAPEPGSPAGGPEAEAPSLSPGWNAVGGGWVYALPDGSPASGWLRCSGSWYWLDPETGLMAVGLAECGGGLYHFSASGSMDTGWVLDGGSWYHASASGALDFGWLSDGGSWYWLDPATGAMSTGWVEAGGSWYFLDPSRGGRMSTGWLLDGGSWYWLSSSGARLESGWLSRGGAWYWIDPSTHAMATGLFSDGSASYVASPSGAMLTGWALLSGSWYHASSSGALDSGWLLDGGSWYWLDPGTLAMATGAFEVGGSGYYAGEDGALASDRWAPCAGGMGWYASPSCALAYRAADNGSGVPAILDGEGNPVTGWVQVCGRWFLAGDDGALLTGWQLRDGKWYYLNSDYTPQVGWMFSGGWYYFDADFSMHVGWLNTDKVWYWLDDTSGRMVSSGWHRCAGSEELFQDNGVWVDTSGTVLGVSRASLLGWLCSHSNDSYYLGTRYATGLREYLCSYPNGDPRNDGYAGLNCGGFVAHAYAKAGGNLAAISNNQNHSPWSNGPGRGGYCNAYRWYGYAVDSGAQVLQFNSVEALLSSGLARKGDLVFFYPYNPYSTDCHIGFFWGDYPGQNRFWHSLSGGNRISEFQYDGPSRVILIR